MTRISDHPQAKNKTLYYIHCGLTEPHWVKVPCQEFPLIRDNHQAAVAAAQVHTQETGHISHIKKVTTTLVCKVEP